jgi:hypothetical protein
MQPPKWRMRASWYCRPESNLQTAIMNRIAKRLLILIVGWVFIVLGIIGLFLPVLQGMLFLIIGLLILSSEYVWAHRLLQKLRQRFPAIGHKADEAREKASAWWCRLFGQRDSD